MHNEERKKAKKSLMGVVFFVLGEAVYQEYIIGFISIFLSEICLNFYTEKKEDSAMRNPLVIVLTKPSRLLVWESINLSST